MKVLLLQHFESYWEGPLRDLHNTNFEECMSKVLDFVASTDDLDKIIITLFEDYELNHEYELLQSMCQNKGIQLDVHTYGYAWYRDPNDEDNGYPEETRNIDWCQGTRDYHGDEDVIELHDWQKELKSNNAEVLLGGAFDGECVKDQEAALDCLEINYERVEGLIVGSGHDYEFVLGSASDIHGSMMCLMSDMAEKYDELLSDCDDDEDLLEEDCLDELIEIEKALNDFVSENRTIIEAYELEFISGNEVIDEMIYENIKHGTAASKYSDIADEKNLVAIKSKLKANDEVPLVEKPKSRNKLTA
jgi:hypothetical protein